MFCPNSEQPWRDPRPLRPCFRHLGWGSWITGSPAHPSETLPLCKRDWGTSSSRPRPPWTMEQLRSGEGQGPPLPPEVPRVRRTQMFRFFSWMCSNCIIIFFYFFLFFFFLIYHRACGILASQPRIEPTPPAVEVRNLTTGPPGKSCIIIL